MRDRKRLVAFLLCVCLITALAVSSAFIVLNAGHACSGEACETCESLAKTEALLRGMACFAFLTLFAACLLAAPNTFTALKAADRPASGTLICWKVRLNN